MQMLKKIIWGGIILLLAILVFLSPTPSEALGVAAGVWIVVGIVWAVLRLIKVKKAFLIGVIFGAMAVKSSGGYGIVGLISLVLMILTKTTFFPDKNKLDEK